MSAMTAELLDELDANAERAAAHLALMAHPQRLRILCLLVDGEQTVTALVERTGLAQPNVSQHLRKMRDAGMVRTRREAQSVLYSLADPATEKILAVLHDVYCG